MKKTILCLTLAGSSVQEIYAEDQSPMLRAQLSLKQAEDFCRKEGHKFQMLSNPIVSADLGGTSELEVIFDYGVLVCDGDSWLYRGSIGAAVDLYAETDDDGYLSKNGYELVPFEGHWAARFKMNEIFSNSQCPENCLRYVYVDGGSFVVSYRQSDWLVVK